MSNNKFFKSGSGSNFGAWSPMYKKSISTTENGVDPEIIENIEEQLSTQGDALETKVDKVENKSLSENDYTNAEKTKLSDLPSSSQLVTDLNKKVDKVLGQSLSENNFTDVLKSKLENLDVDKIIMGSEDTGITIVEGNIFDIKESGFYYATARARNTPREQAGYFILEVLSPRDKQITFVNHTDMTTFMIQEIDGIKSEWFEDTFFTPFFKDKLERLPNISDLESTLNGKVDKVSGKNLSTNDFTEALKTKLETQTLTTNEAQTISGLKTIVGTGELMKLGSSALDGQDGWMTLGNESSYNWKIKYIGSTSGPDGNEFRIESGSTGKYYQMDHNGNMEYFDGSQIHKIWNGSNQGAGSGLDADSVDGMEAKDFISNQGLNLSNTDAKIVEGDLNSRHITSVSNSSGSVNYPSSCGQTWTFQGNTEHRTFSIHRAANGHSLFIKYWNADSTSSDWIKLLHPEDMDIALSTKVDKVSGKGLSANDFTNTNKTKLDGIETAANKYIHPSSHTMGEVSGLSSALDTKVDKVSGKGLSANDFTNANKTKLDGIEIAANKYIHPSSHTMGEVSGLSSALDTKVDKVSGKGLSANDFTNANKTKLDGIETAANKYIHPSSHTMGEVSGLSSALNTKVDKEVGKGLSENDLTDALKLNLEYGVTSSHGLTMLEPKDAKMSLSGNQHGAIKITLPQGFTATMMKLEVDIYDYTSNESIKILISGYNYSTSQVWKNTSVQILATMDHLNYPVRFGYDGSKCCIYIGSLTSAWAYPKVVVSKGVFGHMNYESSQWLTGWRVGIEDNAFQSVSRTHTDNLLQNITDGERTKLAGIETAANKYIHPSTHSMGEISGLSTALGGKVDKVSGKALSANDFTDANKTKLDGIATGANNYVHPSTHTMSQISGLSTALGGKVDKVSGKALSTNDFTDANKTKLDGIATGANNYVHPSTHSMGEVSGLSTALGGKVDKVSGKALSANDFTDANKTKLDGIATSANNYIHPSTHSIGQISGLSTALDGKVDKVSGKVLSSNDFTNANKTKLDGIATGANNYVHPSTHSIGQISGLSTALDGKADKPDEVRIRLRRGSSGWYTIAVCSTGRAIGRIGLRDTTSSRHQTCVFYASAIYSSGNTINIISNAQRTNMPFERIRIKDGGTYDGAVVQVYMNLNDFDSEMGIYLLDDDFQQEHWALINPTPEPDLPLGLTPQKWGTYQVASEVNLLKGNGSLHTTSDIYSRDKKVVTEVELDGKVDKVSGKALSTNDFTNANKTKLDGIAIGANNYVHPSTHSMGQISGLSTALSGKVDKVSGKALSTNDFTNANKTKLDGIATGANNYVHPSTHSMSQVSGLSSALSGKEASFSKNSAFNKNFGTTSGTVMQGNDSRVGNGQTAYTWGNHANANYVQTDASGNLGIGTSSPQKKLHVNGGFARIQTASGYGDIGAENTSWFHFRTDRPQFYMNKPTQIDGDIRIYGKNTYMRRSDGAIYENGKRISTQTYVNQKEQSINNRIETLEQGLERDRIIRMIVDRDRDELQLISNAGAIIVGMPLEDLRREILR